jgi:hypothetical protein
MAVDSKGIYGFLSISRFVNKPVLVGALSGGICSYILVVLIWGNLIWYGGGLSPGMEGLLEVFYYVALGLVCGFVGSLFPLLFVYIVDVFVHKGAPKKICGLLGYWCRLWGFERNHCIHFSNFNFTSSVARELGFLSRIYRLKFLIGRKRSSYEEHCSRVAKTYKAQSSPRA